MGGVGFVVGGEAFFDGVVEGGAWAGAEAEGIVDCFGFVEAVAEVVMQKARGDFCCCAA